MRQLFNRAMHVTNERFGVRSFSTSMRFLKNIEDLLKEEGQMNLLSTKAKLQLSAWDCTTLEQWKSLSGVSHASLKEHHPELANFLNSKVTLPPMDVEQFLSSRINNCGMPGTMKLAEREQFCKAIVNAVKENEKWPTFQQLPSQRPSIASSPKPSLIYRISLRGSGKSQALKFLGATTFADRVARGRLLVICGSKLRVFPKQPVAFLCYIIAEHLREVLGDERIPKQITVEAAVEDWIQRTSDRFNFCSEDGVKFCPLIFIDTCETFVNIKVTTMKHANRLPYNLMEAVASKWIPNLCIVALGSSGVIAPGADAKLFATHVNLFRITAPLGALTLDGFKQARQYWGLKRSVPTTEFGLQIAHWFAGGIPRLLIEACKPMNDEVEIATIGNCWAALITKFLENVRSLYGNVALDAHPKEHLVYVLLASAVRWRMDDTSNDPSNSFVPLPQSEDRKSQDPPKSPRFSDFTAGEVLVKDGEVHVAPSLVYVLLQHSLPSLPLKVELRPLFLPFDVTKVGMSSAQETKRGRPFEEMAVHAILGRYLLILNHSHVIVPKADVKRLNDDGLWVPLSRLLNMKENECGKDIAGISVNLCGGLLNPDAEVKAAEFLTKFPKSLVWNVNVTGSRHDALIHGRRGSGKEGVVALQFRHGNAKTVKELKRQREPSLLALLVVHDTCQEAPKFERRPPTHFIDASLFCRPNSIHVYTMHQGDERLARGKRTHRRTPTKICIGKHRE